jgi:hypothetical protein
LADRLQHGAEALAYFARSLSEEQWRLDLPGDGRSIGVIVHHVASMYPVEVHLAQKLASGLPITGVTMADIHALNAKHAAEHSQVTRETALQLIATNSAAAAAAIRELSDESLAQAATVSLYGDASLTCQFLLEDHAVRHSYHHLSVIRCRLQP